MKATTYISLLLACFAAWGQASLEVIDLRHTTAEQVLPALRPLLEPGGVLTGQRSQLIIRTSPANLAELRRALQTLDAPARRLAILVRFAGASADQRSELAVGVRGSRIEARARQERSTGAERVDQRIQVLEGRRARIATGTSRPLELRDGTLIQDVATGFDVIPRLAGDTVLLEIAPQREVAGRVTRGSVQVERASSTVRARLGEWVELAGVDDAGTSRRIWVRVDEVRP
ncbi:MAG TPA: secretin N-terminal domain-containing protein [Burkholderiales bacterium]|nr:secretin N-terminal domain-containing protein [Burkholderiales bacterium]